MRWESGLREVWIWYGRLLVWMALACAFTCILGLSCRAEGTSGTRKPYGTAWEMPEQEDWGEIERFLQGQYGDAGLENVPGFQELVRSVASGDGRQVGELILGFLGQALMAELGRSGLYVGQILALGILGAVFANFSNIFPSGQVAETGELLTYLLLFTILAAAFSDGVRLTRDVLERQMEFMRVLLPAYCMAVAWAGSGMASMAWMELILCLIAGVEWLYLRLLLPLSQVYLLLVLVGNMTREDILSRMTELLKGAVRWGTRSLIGLVLGFQMIQGMVLPFADSMQLAGVQKLLQVIPGLGAGAGAAAKFVLGSGVLIKNAMGAAAVMVLAVISLVPLVKLAVLMVLYRLAAAVLQPVAKKQLVNAVSGVADGQGMLLGMAVSGMVLFILAIALICLGTNAAYFVL